MQQHDVEVVGLRHPAQLVDLILRIHAVVRGDLGHQPIAIARNTLQGHAQHLVHSAVRLGRLEEADTALVGMAHQPRELFLPQVALYLPGEAPVPNASRVTFTFDFPSVTQSVAVCRSALSDRLPAPASAPAASEVFRNSRLE